MVLPFLQGAQDRNRKRDDVTIRTPSAVFSDCSLHGEKCPEPYCKGRRYRYTLSIPTGLNDDRRCLFILANPSTATPEELDPTVSRCVNYARSWGYGWCVVVNVRAWRATDPKEVPKDQEAIGPENHNHLLAETAKADLVVCGWGKLGGEQGHHVLRLLSCFWRGGGFEIFCLGRNKDGSPKHPLYLRKDAKLERMEKDGGQE